MLVYGAGQDITAVFGSFSLHTVVGRMIHQRATAVRKNIAVEPFIVRNFIELKREKFLSRLIGFVPPQLEHTATIFRRLTTPLQCG